MYIKASDAFDYEHSYQTKFQNITLEVFRSTPVNNALHVEILGRSSAQEIYDPEVYGLSLSVGTIRADRHTAKDVWHLLTIGQTNLQGLASQWPFPWLTASPFISSDPNAPILALRGHVGGAAFTERLEEFHLLLSLLGSPSKTPANSTSTVAHTPFPRVFLEFSSGPLVGSIICKPPHGYKSLAIQLRTEGFCASSTSRYQDDKSLPAHEMFMKSETSLVIEPLFAVVRTDFDGIADDHLAEADLIHHPTALSFETVHIRCQIGAIATIDDRIGSIACVETSTLTADAHISGDAFCLELWHPDVVAATLQILAIFPSKRKVPPIGPVESAVNDIQIGRAHV